MHDTTARLIRCFSSVFPDVDPEQIRSASIESLPWDSLTAVTLAAVLQEEFDVEIDPADFADSKPFQAMENYMRRHMAREEETDSLTTVRDNA